jgi:hydrogen peroxide-dependent heme synthase
MTGAQTNASRIRELNATIRYAMWSVFRMDGRLGSAPYEEVTAEAEAEALLEQLAGQDVVVRGIYDVSALRADADVMVWWHAPSADALQRAYGMWRRTALGRHLAPVWSSMAMHRPAEFNQSHLPAFLAGEPARDYVCVYPFVRSLDWYLLPDDERRKMLVEHGMAGREYPDVRANTVPAFALGDYEWILAFEGPDLARIVELMWKLRYTDARRHVREETPFFTGPRVSPEELVAKLP